MALSFLPPFFLPDALSFSGAAAVLFELLLLPLLPHAAANSATAISAPNRTGTGMRVNNDLLIVMSPIWYGAGSWPVPLAMQLLLA